MKKSILSILFFFIVFAAFSQTYNGGGGAISDDGLANTFALTVTGLSPATINPTHGLVSVCINITHTYDSDLNAQLQSPDGTTILLFSGVGGGDDNFTNTCFNDNAAQAISAGTAPFSGQFQPMDILGNINEGQNGNGQWKLIIIDTYAQDAGSLISWSITFGSGATGPLTVDSTRLPLVLINTLGQTIVDEPKIDVQLKIIDNGAGQYNRPTDSANNFDGLAGIEIHGSFSASLPQKPYGVETRDVLGNNLNVSLLGMPAENDWILLALYNDKVFMRNTLADKLFKKMGHYAARTAFCEVILNNTYQGIYVFTEKIKRDNHRVDIATLDINENAGDSLTGGYIVKLDYHDATNSWLSAYHPVDYPAYDVYYVYYYPKPTDITGPQMNYIQSYMASLEGALYGSNFADPTLGYRAWLDVESFIDYFIVNELSRNNDGFKKSVYFHKNKQSKGGLLHAGPVWDFDWAWKDINECSIFSATDGSGWAYKVNDCSPDNYSNGWMVKMMQDTGFVHQLNCRYFNLRQTLLDTTYLFHYIDSVHTLVNDAQVRHYKKWPTLGINVGTPEIGSQPTTYDGEIAKFKTWIKTRLAWLDANMPGYCPDVSTDYISPPVSIRLFPNPATDVVYFETNGKIVSTQLYSTAGVLMNTFDASYKQTLQLSTYAPGIYFMVFHFADGSKTTRKLVVE
ncbi:MAG: CotH kinase family protein [Bacteroidota bacterium]